MQDLIDVALMAFDAPPASLPGCQTLAPDAAILTELDAKGGHGEAGADWQDTALATLMAARHIDCIAYRGGLVMYEITESGRRFLGEGAL